MSSLVAKQPNMSLEHYEKYGRALHLLPEVPSVGFGVYHRAALGGPRPHASGIVYEICYINRGSVEWWIDNQLYEVGPGNVFINKPGEWYGGSNAMFHPSEVYWVQIEFQENGALPSLTLSATKRLRNEMAGMQARFFNASPEIKDHFDSLLDEYRRFQVYATLAARAALHQIVVTTIRDHSNQMEAQHSPDIERVLQWIDRHRTENYTVEAAAAVANMSPGYFHKRFLDEVGYTPGEYRMRRRIHLAKYLLRDREMPITDIAFMLGFSTSQYFATVFKKLVGLSPRDYRQVIQGSRQ